MPLKSSDSLRKMEHKCLRKKELSGLEEIEYMKLKGKDLKNLAKQVALFIKCTGPEGIS